MDPNVTLAAIRELIESDMDDWGLVEKLVENIQALDEWLSNGGFLPNDWKSFPNLVCDNSLIKEFED